MLGLGLLYVLIWCVGHEWEDPTRTSAAGRAASDAANGGAGQYTGDLDEVEKEDFRLLCCRKFEGEENSVWLLSGCKGGSGLMECAEAGGTYILCPMAECTPDGRGSEACHCTTDSLMTVDDGGPPPATR